MNVFDLRQRLIEDYAEYMRSFLDIADPRLPASWTSTWPLACSVLTRG
jgi:hypothetical protein